MTNTKIYTGRRVLWLIAGMVLSMAGMRASAQSDATLSQYYEMPAYYNPGAIGTTDYLQIRGGARMQWMGIDGAPRTFIVGANMPLKLFDKRFGIGLLMQQESLGLYRNMNLGVQLAYKIKLLKGQLSIGAQIGLVDEKFKGTGVFIPGDDDYHDPGDDAIPNSDIGGSAFDLGIGAYYTHRLFWAGVSVTHATSPTITMNAESGEGTQEHNYEFQVGRTAYFMAGSNIPIKNTLFELIPSVLYRTDFQFWTVEGTARVRYAKFLTAGVGYRYNDGLVATVSAEYKGFFLGYSYDYPLSDISKISSGSHEILAGYSLKLDLGEKNKNKHKSIRIM